MSISASESNNRVDFKKLMCVRSRYSLDEAIGFVFNSLDLIEIEVEDLHEDFFFFIYSRVDPPLEVLWIHAALTLEPNTMHDRDFDGRIAYVKHQFGTICERSVSSGVSKSIAMLAPVCLWISGLFVFVYTSNYGMLDLDSVTQNEMVREIRSVVDLVLGYVSVCCCCSNDEGSSHQLYKPLSDMLSLWMRKKTSDMVMTSTFSSLSDEQRLRLSRNDGCEVSELAGAVAAQLFLMRLGMSIEIAGENADKKDLEKELISWGIATLTGLRNLDLFVMLLQIILEPEPKTSTLGSQSGTILRKVLYDIMLVDYAYLDLECVDHSSSELLKDIALMRLAVAFEAVEYFREEIGDLSKAISCENAFSSSRLSAQIAKLVPSDAVLNNCKRNGSSPTAFLKWFVDLEQQGVKVFSESTAKFSDKLSLKPSKQSLDSSVRDEVNDKDVDADDDEDVMFLIDKVGERDTENEDVEEEADKMSNAFMAAAHTMNTTEPSKVKKRKGGLIDKGKKKLKRSVDDGGDDDDDDDLSDSSGEENKSSTDADSDESEG